MALPVDFLVALDESCGLAFSRQGECDQDVFCWWESGELTLVVGVGV